MINREKLTSKYRMVMVKNKALGKYVNDTLKKIDSLCQQNDNCNTYIRGDVKKKLITTKTKLRPPKKIEPKPPPKKVKPKPPPKKVEPKPPPKKIRKKKLNVKPYKEKKIISVENIPDEGGKYTAIAQYKNMYYFIQNKHQKGTIHNYISKSSSFDLFKDFSLIRGPWDNQKSCLVDNVAFLPTSDKLFLFGGTGNSDHRDRLKKKYCDGHSISDINKLTDIKTVIEGTPIDTDALPSVVRYANQYYVYTRLNINSHYSGKRGVRLYKLSTLNKIERKHIQIKLPFYSYTQNVVFHDGLFHAFFCSYDRADANPYEKIKIAYAVSPNGVDFSVISRDLFPGNLVYVVNGFVKEKDNTLVFFKNFDTGNVFYISLKSDP